MAPEQCPGCARFLSAAFVTSLASGPRACPGCDASLTGDQFANPTEGGGDLREGAATVDDVDDSDVLDGPDVLEGWDVGGEASAWRDDQPPFPVDAAWVGAGAAAGALLGVVTTRRMGGMFSGALLGAVAVGVVRRIWELDPDV